MGCVYGGTGGASAPFVEKINCYYELEMERPKKVISGTC